MELHLHLSVAFRALDRKWGKPVDLDQEEDSVTCLPAVVDIDTTTFSSEEYLKTVKKNRYKSYQQIDGRRKTKLNKCDSFSNISITKLSASSGFYSSEETLSDCKTESSRDNTSSEEISQKIEKRKGLKILKQLKLPLLFNLRPKRKRDRSHITERDM